MWRATFLAIGIYLCILGAECLVVDRAILNDGADAATATQNASLFTSTSPGSARKEYQPKEWMPWSMLSTGAVVILYSFTIPRRVNG